MQARAPNVGNFARQFPMADQLFGESGNALTVSGSCTKDGRQTFTLVWARQAFPNDTRSATTTLFCNPRYVFYDANITTTPNGAILAATRTSTAQDMPSTRFKFTRLEEILYLETVPYGTMNANFPVNTLPIAPQTVLSDIWEFNNLVGYGLALRPANYTEYLNRSVLQQTFEATTFYMFQHSIRSVHTPPGMKPWKLPWLCNSRQSSSCSYSQFS